MRIVTILYERVCIIYNENDLKKNHMHPMAFNKRSRYFHYIAEIPILDDAMPWLCCVYYFSYVQYSSSSSSSYDLQHFWSALILKRMYADDDADWKFNRKTTQYSLVVIAITNSFFLFPYFDNFQSTSRDLSIFSTFINVFVLFINPYSWMMLKISFSQMLFDLLLNHVSPFAFQEF